MQKAQKAAPWSESTAHPKNVTQTKKIVARTDNECKCCCECPCYLPLISRSGYGFCSREFIKVFGGWPCVLDVRLRGEK